jgi:hypothetical protein
MPSMLDDAAKKNAFDSRWCWKQFDDERWIDGHHFWEARECAPYSYVLHLFASGAKIAYFHWLRYDFTQDKEWLREYGYPIIKGVAEFYRNYPNVKIGDDGKYHIHGVNNWESTWGDDGKYHIHGVNNWESTWGASDTIEELAAMRAVTATAIRASQVLGVDEDMRGVWQEFLDNMTPLPTFTDTSDGDEQRYWVNTKHSSVGRSSTNRRATTPCTSYDMFTLETTDPEMVELASNSYVPLSNRQSGRRRIGELSKATITAATMGDVEGIKTLVPAQIRYEGLEEGYPDMSSSWARWRGPLRNRLSLMEGYQGMGGQRLGNAMEGLVLALCRATPAGPAGETVIRVFPAWPKEWDAQYSLLARGNFLVTSSIRKGVVEFVEIQSQSGGECRLRNPFADQANISVTVYKNGRKFKDMDGSLLTFETNKGDSFVIVQKDSSPDQYKRIVLGE